jgi:hypothetical protein
MELTQEQLVRQYELMVNSALQVTTWRHSTNHFYLAVNTALLTIAAYLYNILPGTGIIIGIIGVVITALWYDTIRYFRDLNKAKFLVIHEVENQLPMKMFQLEDAHFSKEGRKRATSIESNIPILFGVAYIVLVIALLLKSSGIL